MSNVAEMVRDRLAELRGPLEGPNNVQLNIRVDEVDAAMLDFLASQLGMPSRSSTGRFLLNAAMHEALGEMGLVLGFDPLPVIYDEDNQVVFMLVPPTSEEPDA